MSLETRLSNSSRSVFESKHTIIIIIVQNEKLHIIVSIDYNYKKSSTSLVLENAIYSSGQAKASSRVHQACTSKYCKMTNLEITS